MFPLFLFSEVHRFSHGCVRHVSLEMAVIEPDLILFCLVRLFVEDGAAIEPYCFIILFI